jgi:hypothetical protein
LFLDSLHLGEIDADKELCEAQSTQKSNSLQNKRNKTANEVGLSAKKLRVDTKTGPDDIDEPRKEIALTELIDVKGKKRKEKWAPSVKKLAKT